MTEIDFRMSDATFGIFIIIAFFLFILGLWLGMFAAENNQELDNLPNLSCKELKKYIEDDHYSITPVTEYLKRCSSMD